MELFCFVKKQLHINTGYAQLDFKIQHMKQELAVFSGSGRKGRLLIKEKRIRAHQESTSTSYNPIFLLSNFKGCRLDFKVDELNTLSLVHNEIQNYCTDDN